MPRAGLSLRADVASSHKYGQSPTNGRSAGSHCLNQLVDPPARHTAFAHEASAFRALLPSRTGSRIYGRRAREASSSRRSLGTK